MGYKIIKGWPDDSALDLPMEVESGNSIIEGHTFWLNDSGNAEVADYNSNGSENNKLFFYCIDSDTVTGNVIGLSGNFMIEVESDLYWPGNYHTNLGVTSKEGKFSIPVGTEDVVGYVVRYTSSTGKLIITWNG